MFIVSKVFGSGWLSKQCSSFAKGFFCGSADQLVSTFTHKEIRISSRTADADELCIEALLTAVLILTSKAPEILFKAVPGNYF